MLPELRKRKETEDGEQRPHRFHTGSNSPFASSPTHPPSSLAFRNGGMSPTYSKNFIPGGTQCTSPLSLIPPVLNPCTNTSAGDYADGSPPANPPFLQGPFQAGAYRDVLKRAPSSDILLDDAPPTLLSSKAMAYNQTSSLSSKRTGKLLPGPVSLFVPPDVDWHKRHQSARLGVDVGYQAFLSPNWPGFPTLHANGPVIVGNGSQTRADTPLPLSPQPQMNTSFTSSQSPGSGRSWPFICCKCKELDNQYQHVLYQNKSSWLVHAWAIHPSDKPWVPCKCLWEGCDNGIIYHSSKKWITHALSVHQKDVYCDFDDCEYSRGNQQGKAFGTPSEKKRHTQQKHDDPETCQLPYCTHKKGRVNRMDKRTKHDAIHHGRFICTVGGCLRGCINSINYGFHTQALLDDHIRKNKHRQASSLLVTRA